MLLIWRRTSNRKSLKPFCEHTPTPPRTELSTCALCSEMSSLSILFWQAIWESRSRFSSIDKFGSWISGKPLSKSLFIPGGCSSISVMFAPPLFVKNFSNSFWFDGIVPICTPVPVSSLIPEVSFCSLSRRNYADGFDCSLSMIAVILISVFFAYYNWRKRGPLLY